MPLNQKLNCSRLARAHYIQGFTLIELSIVLVIISLIIGGILTGQDLIDAAIIRSQLSQIEKYNTAVRTFQGKYGGLPGDLELTAVSNFGFHAGPGCNGGKAKRDGNGLLDGWSSSVLVQGEGEVAMFWQDLGTNGGGYTTAGLITDNIPSADISGFVGSSDNHYAFGCSGLSYGLTLTGIVNIGSVFPAAKIGNGNFVYVYEDGSNNWYGISSAGTLTNNGGLMTSPGITPKQAYNLDSKIDDGIPNSGSVKAIYLNNWNITTSPNAATSSITTCFNNATKTYSVGFNAATCAVSFRFQ